MSMTIPRSRLDWLQLLHRFSLFFVCVAAVSLMHRWSAFNVFVDGIDYTKTYNPYRGFDPIGTAFAEYRGALFSGFRADLAFACISALVLSFMPRVIIGAFFVFLVGFYAANLEHVRFNLTNLDLSLLSLGADPVFLSAHFNLGIVETAGTYAVIIGCFIVLAMRIVPLKYIFTALAIGLIVVGVRPSTTLNIAQPVWLQSHPLLASFGDSSLAEDPRIFDAAELERPFLPTVTAPTTRKNVVVLYLEGLSQASIANGEMTVLEDLSETGVMYTRHFSHQLITANGLYSTLTGQLPRFVGPSTSLTWFEMEDDDPEVVTALPRQLASLGYNTSFVQSANLAYMAKDEQLPRLGFDAISGADRFGTWYARNGWGVDDLTLLEGVMDEIDQFPAGEPWMIAALTTGTHAPYNVPADFLPDAPTERYRALRWLDAAIGQFVDGLRDRGLLDDTIVVITSDESRERIVGSPLANEIALNWLPLIILNTDEDPRVSTEIITSSDFPWLMLSQATGTDLALPGTAKDSVLFGNVISGRFFWYGKQNQELLACETSNYTCGVFSQVTDLGNLEAIVPERVAVFPGLRDLIAP